MIFLISSFADACDFAAKTSYPVQQVKKCFETIPFNLDLSKKTLMTIKSVMRIYPFTQLANHTKTASQFQINSKDIKKEMEDLYASMKENSFEYDYAFNDKLAQMFRELYDAHTKWRIPMGYGQFKAVTGVIPVYNPQDKKYEFQFIKDKFPSTMYADLRAKNQITPDLENVQIAKVNGVAPEEYFEAQARKLAFIEKNVQARYNEFMSEAVYERSMRLYSLFDLEDMKVELENGVTVTVTFQLFSEEAVSMTQIVNKNKRQGKLSEPKQVVERVKKSMAKPLSAIQYVFKGEYFKLYRDGQMFHINIDTFMPSNVEKYVDEFQACMAALDKEQDGHLVVEVAQNGGGYITLGYRMLSVLSPYTQPKWGNYNVIKNKINQYFVANENDKRNVFATQERFDLKTGKTDPLATWFFEREEVKSLSNNDANVSDVFKETYSDRYSFDLAYDETPASAFEKLINTPTPKWLNTADNTKLIFVTDGTCGSTCACFTLRAFEADAGLFLFMGGNPKSVATGSVASFAGGSVMSFDYLDQFDLKGYNISKFESSGSFSLAHEQVFSWTKPEEPLEYAVRNTHDKIDVHYSQDGWYSEQKIVSILEQVKQKIAICYDFQHKSDAACPKTVQNGVFGHVCKNMQFEQECKLVACDLGFQLVGQTCVKVNKKYSDVKDSTTLTAVGCSLSVFVTAAIAVLVAIYVKMSVRREKEEAALQDQV